MRRETEIALPEPTEKLFKELGEKICSNHGSSMDDTARNIIDEHLRCAIYWKPINPKSIERGMRVKGEPLHTDKEVAVFKVGDRETHRIYFYGGDREETFPMAEYRWFVDPLPCSPVPSESLLKEFTEWVGGDADKARQLLENLRV